MAKQYIYQLSGGAMLVFQDGWVGVEAHGYPLPDCSMQVGGRLYKGQNNVMRMILGYDIENPQVFIAAAMKFDPMRFDDFKYKVMSENIGGGCPARLRDALIDAHDSGLSKNLSLFKHILPRQCVAEVCGLPNEERLVADFGDMLRINWVAHQNVPNWKFRNNIILLTGCREVTDKHIAFIKSVARMCMKDSEKGKYKYISGITLENGNGAIVLIDSYIGHYDVAFLYQKVTGADLSVGKIVGNVDGDGFVTMSFEYVDTTMRRRKFPVLKGAVRREPLF